MLVAPRILVAPPPEGSGDTGAGAVEIARTFVEQGARALVLRDVGAMLARTDTAALSKIAASVARLGVPVTYDAALEDASLIETIAALPFQRIVVGQKAALDGMLGRWTIDMLGRRACVEIALDGDYLFDPPKSAFGMTANEAVERMVTLGVPCVMVRDITGTELPLRMLRTVCDELGLPAVFNGMIRSLTDIRELAVVSSGNLLEVIVGDPLFDGSMRLAEANAAADGLA